MDRSNIVYMCGVTWTTDSIMQRVKSETQRQVFCQVESVTRAEWNAAGQKGLNPSLVFSLFASDYNGEEDLIFNGVRYRIYRTYLGKDETIELYTEKVTDEQSQS